MANTEIAKRKSTGAHFTPQELAHFVAKKIIFYTQELCNTPVTVLDPACGDGELLLAMVENVPYQMRENLSLMGIDADRVAFHNAQARLQNLGVGKIDLRLADFLEVCPVGLHAGVMSARTLSQKVDIIIANPPYVRTQVLGAEKAQALAAAFGLSGRIDLYHAFLVAMTRCLKIGGIMGVITSNRFITTKSGNTIRQLLSQEYDLLELIDLGDTKLFEAAVLPAILLARHSGTRLFSVGQKANFLKIYETNPNKSGQEVASIYEALYIGRDGVYSTADKHYRITTGILEIPVTPQAPWIMISETENDWRKAILASAHCCIENLVKVRVGVKTTADEVFIRADWDSLPPTKHPESELLHPLLSAEDTGRWKAITAPKRLKKILYPHVIERGRRRAIDLLKYPHAAAYLEEYKDRLERREYVVQANRHWYEIWVPQDPAAWQAPKIVFPDISAQPNFLYDPHGAIVDGNCYWLKLEPHQDANLLFLILGVANSQLMIRYHDLAFNNKLYAGRRRYLTQYVGKYPIPNPSIEASRRIVETTKSLVLNDLPPMQVAELEEQLDNAVMAAFGVDYIPMD